MRKPVFLLWVILHTAALCSQPIPIKLNQYVIIDTDGAIDDLRAISILLSRPEITIKAIVTSDGSLPPAEGYEKVRALLRVFNHDTICVAAGDALKEINPPWREFNRQIKWTDVQDVISESQQNALDCLIGELKIADEKFVLVCLGPLTNIAGLIKAAPLLLNKIERIIWYNESMKPPQGFNYECDKNAADQVFNSGIRIDVISNLKKENAFFDASLVDWSRQSETQLAGIINYVYGQPPVIERLQQNHFRLSDDLTALYLTNPELFDMNIMQNKVKIRFNQDYDDQGVKEAIYDMISGIYVSGKNVVFNKFPDQREMFNYDIRPIVDSAIARYGQEEWKATVMTDEFHGHLGIYSIVGAKMGIRAREYFGVGSDMLKVLTYAGSKPPYSCLTDGIQVSTGATLGMGTIELAKDSITNPAAIFTYKDHAIRITLKKEYLEQVDADINEGIVKFGLMDDGYWKLVRRNALKYWLEWDRNKIFDVDVIK